MRVIPAVPYDTDSEAERKIFDFLREIDLGSESVALHSLSLSDVHYRLAGEIDFVIVCREGILILEVKGGGVKVVDGVWYFTNRYGQTNRKRRGPFKQAEEAAFRLKRDLSDEGLDLRDHLLAHGVCFPDIRFDQHSTEWPDEIVFDQRFEASPQSFGRYLKGLFRYWRTLKANTEPLSKGLIEDVAGYLRPSFEVLPSISSVLSKLQRRMDKLTEDQCAAVDAAERFPQLICEGGAGTGKTFIAMHVARQLAVENDRVGLVVWNPSLAAFLQSRLTDPRVAVICYKEASKLESNSLDALVVDEGQDLMRREYLAELERILVGGLTEGSWRIFLDPNAQSGLEGNFDRATYESLVAGHHPLVLKRNCRNTQDIVLQTRLISGADMGVAFAGDGPPVEIHYWKDKAGAAKLIEEQLLALQMSGVRPEDITILSPYEMVDSSLAQVSPAVRARIVNLTPEVARNLPLQSTSFSTIRNFKGLENSLVIATDLDRLDNDGDLATFYVAMSRARGRLLMNVAERLRTPLRDLQLKHVSLMTQDTANVQH
ncbi:MAG: NERD domain-containing protein [Armatimonadetes bacterium]|nr:NERD domain-containing protein [Armatimonadota bacterium]